MAAAAQVSSDAGRQATVGGRRRGKTAEGRTKRRGGAPARSSEVEEEAKERRRGYRERMAVAMCSPSAQAFNVLLQCSGRVSRLRGH